MTTEATVQGQQVEGSVAEVVTAAQEAWRVAGRHADVVAWESLADLLGLDSNPLTEQSDLTAAIIVHDARLVECVVEPSRDLAAAVQGFTAILAHGWDVNALLPIRCMSSAHEAWRGLDIQLQGWWTTAEHGLRFTSPEMP